MRSILKILLVPAAIGLGATAANAAPGNIAAPAPATVDARSADQNVIAVRDGRKHWRNHDGRKHWRRAHRSGHRWHGYYGYQPYSHYYYPGYYYPRSYYHRPRFSFSFGF